MAESQYKVFVHDGTVHYVRAQPNGWLMHILEPVFQELFHSLLGPCCEDALLLLIERGMELLLYLAARLAVECLPFPPIQGDACSPAAILPLVNRSLAVSPFLADHLSCSLSDTVQRNMSKDAPGRPGVPGPVEGKSSRLLR